MAGKARKAYEGFTGEEVEALTQGLLKVIQVQSRVIDALGAAFAAMGGPGSEADTDRDGEEGGEEDNAGEAEPLQGAK